VGLGAAEEVPKSRICETTAEELGIKSELSIPITPPFADARGALDSPRPGQSNWSDDFILAFRVFGEVFINAVMHKRKREAQEALAESTS
jgi:hypothetical protein